MQPLINTLEAGDFIVDEFGEETPVVSIVRNRDGTVTAAVILDKEGNNNLLRHDDLVADFSPQPYVDTNTGEKKIGAASQIKKKTAQQPTEQIYAAQITNDGAQAATAAGAATGAAAVPAPAGPAQVEGGGVAANKFDPKGLKPGTPEYNVAFDKWSSEQQGEKAAQEVARQRQENKAAVQKRNGWRAKLREWFLAAKDGDTISDVTGQTYKVIEKTRRDGTKIKSLAAVDEKGNSLGEGRAATGISQVGDRIDGLNDGGIDDDTGSALPETAGQSLASGL